jgi:hypothetical protein
LNDEQVGAINARRLIVNGAFYSNWKEKVIAVGAAFENDLALKRALDQIKPIVERAPGLESNELLGLHECSEDGNTLW